MSKVPQELRFIAGSLVAQTELEKGSVAFLAMLERMASDIADLREIAVRNNPAAGPADNSQPEPLLVTLKEAKARTGLSNSTLYNMIRDGQLDSKVVGGRRLIVFKTLKDLALVRGAP
jgi:excisionase family DNA binding protein